MAVLDDIRDDHAALAAGLHRLVDDFKYETILGLIEQATTHSGASSHE